MTNSSRAPRRGQSELADGRPHAALSFLKTSCSLKKMAHFNREGGIPERVVHAKGSGAHGHFTCTNPQMPKYTTAGPFSSAGEADPYVYSFLDRRREKEKVLRTRSAIPVALLSSSTLKRVTGTWWATIPLSSSFVTRSSFSDFIHTQKA